MTIDPNGPCPMEYHAAMEWRSLQAGEPLAVPGSHSNTLPMEYHARMDSLRFYATRGREGKSHRGTTVR